MPSPYGSPQASDKAKPFFYGVRASYTTNLASLLAATTTCDGVTLVEDDLALLTEQTASETNGIYKVGAVTNGTAPLTREVAISSYGYPPGTRVFISEGTTRGNTERQLTNNLPIVLGTTSLVFAAYPALATFTSLESRLSLDESVTSASAVTSLDTRVSTELSTRTSADASLVVVCSANLSSRVSADASLAVVASTNLSALTSSVVSLTTRLSSEESKLTSHIG